MPHIAYNLILSWIIFPLLDYSEMNRTISSLAFHLMDTSISSLPALIHPILSQVRYNLTRNMMREHPIRDNINGWYGQHSTAILLHSCSQHGAVGPFIGLLILDINKISGDTHIELHAMEKEEPFGPFDLDICLIVILGHKSCQAIFLIMLDSLSLNPSQKAGME